MTLAMAMEEVLSFQVVILAGMVSSFEGCLFLTVWRAPLGAALHLEGSAFFKG